MNERQKRDFEAGLSEEVDAWLRGEPTRRDLIKRVGQAAGMLALSGGALSPFVSSALAQAQVELEDPSTPLGKAQAAALAASMEGPTDGSAYIAVENAKQFRELLEAVEPGRSIATLIQRGDERMFFAVRIPAE